MLHLPVPLGSTVPLMWKKEGWELEGMHCTHLVAVILDAHRGRDPVPQHHACYDLP